MTTPTWSLAIHGGAGLIARARLSEAREAGCTQVLRASLEAGAAVLEGGGNALDASVAAVRVMEESPFFNAAIGGVLNEDGVVECDASVMEGHTGRAGAVTGLKRVRAPILGALEMMRDGTHVTQACGDAERWLLARGLEEAPESWFIVEERKRQWQRARETSTVVLDHGNAAAQEPDDEPDEDVYGTVGAVARDVHGNLAAATSTGGMTNKRAARVSDSAIIGAGTWADAFVATSGTGHGEYFIRSNACARVGALVELGGLSVDEACARVLDRIAELGGTGGIIAVDAAGRISVPFNSGGMFRGTWRRGSDPQVSIW